MQKEGNIDDKEMFTTFNMGIGLIIVTDKKNADQALDLLKKSGKSL